MVIIFAFAMVIVHDAVLFGAMTALAYVVN